MFMYNEKYCKQYSVLTKSLSVKLDVPRPNLVKLKRKVYTTCMCLLKRFVKTKCDAIQLNQSEVKHETFSVLNLIEVFIWKGTFC